MSRTARPAVELNEVQPDVRERAMTSLLLVAVAVLAGIYGLINLAAAAWGGSQWHTAGALLGAAVSFGGLTCAMATCADRSRRRLRLAQHSVAGMLLLTVVMSAVLLQPWNRSSDSGASVTAVVQRLEAAGATKPSDNVSRYYVDLYGPTFDADEGQVLNIGASGVTLVLDRGDGYDELEEGELQRQAAQVFGTDEVGVVVWHGVAVVVLGSPDVTWIEDALR